MKSEIFSLPAQFAFRYFLFSATCWCLPTAGLAAPLFRSPVLKATDKAPTKPLPVKVDLQGAKQLFLTVSDLGDKSCDWADWLEPTLVMADGSTQDLTKLPWKAASAGSGKVNVGKNFQGGPLLVGGKTYTSGFGTHATSVIAFDLPTGVASFTASVAIDDGGLQRVRKASGADVQFSVSTQPLETGPQVVPDGPPLVPVDLFQVPEGLEVTVWASSPLLYNPTNMDFDAQGRLYVAEGVNYRGKAGRRPEGDRIVILEDTKGAGKADKATVFTQSQDLASPLGVAVLDDKVVVSQPPDLLVYTDANRDGVFDAATEKRDVLLTGFNGRQHDHSLHSVTAGPDGQWYFNQGNTGAQFTDKSGKTFRMGSPYVHANGKQAVDPSKIAGQKSDDGNVWIGGFTARMNPDGTQAKILGHNYRNSFEQTVNSFGDIFQSDNDDPPACRVSAVLEGGNAGFASADGKRSWNADKRPQQTVPIAEWRQEDPGTMPVGDVYGGGSPTGVGFYENGSLGGSWNGLLLACEAARNVVFGYRHTPDGAGFKLERFDFMTSNTAKKWAGSDFLGGGGSATNELMTKFRPSDVCVGPDGAIYVADWFDPAVGGHGTKDGGYSGTIYRIAPKGFKSVVPKFDLQTTAGQITALLSPAVNVRNSGFVRLKAQGSKAVPEVVAVLQNPNPFLAARAAWLLAQMGPEGIASVKALLGSKSESLRLVAYRALRFVNHDLLVMAKQMAADPSAAVRREVALSMREVPAEKSTNILVEIARQFNGQDRSYLEALGLGSTGKETEVFTAISKAQGSSPENWTEAFAWIAWRFHQEVSVPDFKARILNEKLSLEQRKLMLTALAFVPTRSAADAMLAVAHTPNFPLQEIAQWWLLNRKGNDWNAFDIEKAMKVLKLYDPDSVKLVAVEMPPIPADAPALPPVAEIAKLKGDSTRGQAAVVLCQNCHRMGNVGVDFGPDLTAFAKQQSREVVIEAIAKPSATLSHGFEGSVVKTKDGLTITGMILSNGDPVLMKCMGGQIQTIPKKLVASITPMKQSLMYEPSQLGLTAQMVADITAFLKGE